MSRIIFTIILVLTYQHIEAQMSLSIGSGVALFSADESLLSSSESFPSRSSLSLYLEPSYNINEKVRVGVSSHFALQNKFRSFIFGTDFKIKPEEPFYIGFGIGPIQYQASSFKIYQITTPFGNRMNSNEKIVVESSLGLAPRIGFRGSFDFYTSLAYVPEFSRGFLLFGLSYVIGNKSNKE